MLTLCGPFRGPCRSKMVPWALVELNNDQISVGQPHPAHGLKPLNNNRSLGLPRESIVNFSHPSLCHQYNTIGKPETEPCRYTSYIHQYVRKTSILAYIHMLRRISLFSALENCPDGVLSQEYGDSIRRFLFNEQHLQQNIASAHLQHSSSRLFRSNKFTHTVLVTLMVRTVRLWESLATYIRKHLIWFFDYLIIWLFDYLSIWVLEY